MSVTIGTLRRRATKLGLNIVHYSYNDGGRWQLYNDEPRTLAANNGQPVKGYRYIYEGHGEQCKSWYTYVSSSMTSRGDGPRYAQHRDESGQLVRVPCTCSGKWSYVPNPKFWISGPLSLAELEAAIDERAATPCP